MANFLQKRYEITLYFFKNTRFFISIYSCFSIYNSKNEKTYKFKSNSEIKNINSSYKNTIFCLIILKIKLKNT